MENKELTISDILNVDAKVRLVQVTKEKQAGCERCILHSLCGDATILKSDLCFQDAPDGKDWIYTFEKAEE